MLVAICFFYIISSTPFCLYLTIHSFIFDTTISHHAAKKLLVNAIVLLTLYSNNAVNFIVCCLSGSLFRKELYDALRQIKISLQRCMNRDIYPIANLRTAWRTNDKGKTVRIISDGQGFASKTACLRNH